MALPRRFNLPRLGAAFLSAIVLTCAALIVATAPARPHQSASVGGGSVSSPVLLAAQALAHAPNVVVDATSAILDPRLLPSNAAVRQYAAQKSLQVPLAPGGTFATIAWRRMDLLTPEQVEGFLEYDAACSWYRYVAGALVSGPASGVALGEQVIAQIPQWPTFRLNVKGVRAWSIWQATAQGNQLPIEEEAAGDCSH